MGPRSDGQHSPRLLVHRHGIAGPNLGPQWSYWAYWLLPHGQGRFHQGIFPPSLHLDLEVILRITAHHLIIPGPTKSMAQVSSPSLASASRLLHHSIMAIDGPELCVGLLYGKVVVAMFQGRATSSLALQYQGRSILPPVLVFKLTNRI